MEFILCLKLCFCVLLCSISGSARKKFHRRGPHTCGPTAMLKCCSGWTAAPYSNLCIHRCFVPSCQDHRFYRHSFRSFDREKRSTIFQRFSQIQSNKNGHVKTKYARRSPHLTKRSRGIPHHPSRKLFRPHIMSQDQLPEIGYRTLSRHSSSRVPRPSAARSSPHASKLSAPHRKSAASSSSRWKNYFKQKKNTRNIRRIYRNGHPVVLHEAKSKKQVRTFNLKSLTAVPNKPILNIINSSNKKNNPRHKKGKKKFRVGKSSKNRNLSRRRKKKVRHSFPFSWLFQSDQPFTDLVLPDEKSELVLKDLVYSKLNTNATDKLITLTGSNSTIENLGIVCRGDLCLQKQRLLNYNFTSLVGLLDPSEVDCPPGYFKAVRANILVCEAYRKSVKRKGRRKKKKKRKQQTTTSSPAPVSTDFVSKLLSTTTDASLVDLRTVDVSSNTTVTTVTVKHVKCPEGQRENSRGDIIICETEDTSPSQETDIDPDIYSQTCPRRQRIVYKNGITFCADENDFSVCDFEQDAVEKDGVLFCEDEITSKVDIVSKLPPRRNVGPTTVCPLGQETSETDSGVICTDINTSLESAKPNKFCINDTEPVTIDGMLVCKERPDLVVIGSNGDCPDHYIVTNFEGKVYCRKDVVTPKEGICPVSYSLYSIDNTWLCVYDYPILENVGIKPINNCPNGFLLFELDSKIICKKFGEDSKRDIDLIRPRRGQCPKDYILVTKDRHLMCRKAFSIDGSKVFLPISEHGVCPVGYAYSFFEDNPVCMKDNLKPDVLEPIDDKCPEGYLLLSSDERTICEKETNVPFDCPKGQKLVDDLGTKVCKSIFDLPPDLNCPPGYRIFNGVCEDEGVIRVLIDSDKGVQCPDDQVLVERNSMYICEPKPTECLENQLPVPKDGKIVCVDTQDRRVTQTTPEPNVKCLPGEKVSVKNGLVHCEPLVKCLPGERVSVTEGEVHCEPNRGDIDIKHEISETSTKSMLRECPEGSNRLVIDGKTFCDCPKGYNKILLRGGNFDCELKTEQCLEGYISIQLENGTHSCIMENCQEGFSKVWRFDKYVCEPEKVIDHQEKSQEGTWIDPSQVDCPKGYVRALKNNLLVCQSLRGSVLSGTNVSCSSNEILILDNQGPRCEIFKCAEDETLEMENGVRSCRKVITTSPQPVCPVGMELVQSKMGAMCQYKELTTVSIPTTTITCPDNKILVRTETGLRCIWIQTPKTTTTEAPCPAGLTPRVTGVGVICVFEGNTITTHTSPVSCPKGQILMKTINGESVCGFERPVREPCKRGQVDVHPSGDQSVCKNITDLTPEENPCPVGLQPEATDDGFQCKYTEKRIHDVHGDISCVQGQILTLTQFGFFCENLIVDEELINCMPDQVLVQVHQKLKCVSKQFTRLTCDEGYRVVETDSGYFCEIFQFDIKKECDQGEILIIQETRRVCKKLEKNIDLCGKGYKAVMTEEGFVCNKVHLPLDCPDGFHILNGTDGKSSCYPLEDTTPCLTDVPCENGVRLIPCKPGYNIIDGVKGPECELGDFIEVVCSEDRTCVAESCKTGYGTKTCQDLLQLVLDGCIPQCSNGGSCVNKTCHCPPGVTGNSCEKDIDECAQLDKGYCQYGCLNTFGSFHCRCPDGATLNEDRKTCKSIGCIPDCMNNGVCVNGVCSCPRGFNGSVCENDIDECKESNGLCEFQCRNTFGSYSCVCPPGSRLRQDGRSCLNVTCIPECKNGGRCENHKCLCPDGFYGVICQLDINECYENKPCSHNCLNTPGSYRCTCPQWARLSRDRHNCYNITASIPTL